MNNNNDNIWIKNYCVPSLQRGTGNRLFSYPVEYQSNRMLIPFSK